MLVDRIKRHERGIVVAILLAFVAIAVTFNVNSPLLEGPNEVEHYRFMRLIAENGELPDRAGYPYGQLHQAPLYYIIGSPVLRWIDDPEWEEISQRFNPYHAYEFTIPSSDNKNIHLHLESDADSNVAMVVFWLRLYSTLLGTLTVIMGYGIMRLVFPDNPSKRLIGLAVVAFSPQFVYMSSSINNDNFLFFGAALAFYFAMKQVINKPTYIDSALLGFALGIALLSKASAGMLVFPMAIYVLLDRRTWFWYAPVTLVMTILVSGWWYIENYAVYGDFTLVQTMFTTWPSEIMGEGGTPLWGEGIRRAWYGYESFWGRYGHGAVALGEEIYWFFDVIVILSLIGLFAWSFQQWRTRDSYAKSDVQLTVIVLSFTLVWIFALIYSSSTVLSGNQGRYLMPGFAGWGILIAVGLSQLMPKRVQAIGSFVFVLLMAGVLVYSQLVYFVPAYQLSDAPIDAETIYRYDDIIELIDVQPTRISAEPNEVLELTLAWRVVQPTERELLTYVHSANTETIRRNSYPGTGLYLTPDWQAGDRWSETYIIRIPDNVERQRVYPLIAGYYDLDTEQRMEAISVDGSAVTPFIAEIIVPGDSDDTDFQYQLTDLLTMAEPTLLRDSGTLELCFRWNATQSLSADYQMLVHLLDDEGEIVSQADFQPRRDTYPTRVWQAGETVQDCVQTMLSETVNQVAIGMYDLATVTRLTLQTNDGNTLQNNVLIMEIPNE